MTTLATRDNRAPASFWVLAIALLIFVALCTGQRDNHWQADAWEYHRVIHTLTQDLWQPGNPTYAIDAPSVRYSPYGLLWATFARVTGIDSYHVLGVAAVVNVALLVFGMLALLRSYGEGAAATAALILTFALFGGVPGFSCSYALADLPWLGVNPSAFSFGLTMWLWVAFHRLVPRRPALGVVLVTTLASAAMLDHGMIGAFAQGGIWLLALTAEPGQRLRHGIAAVAIGCGTLLLCGLWPWFAFLRTITEPLPAGMLSDNLLRTTLFVWCFPALLLSTLAWLCRDRKLVRVCLLGGYACYAAGLSTLFLPDWFPMRAALARLPLPGLIFFHLAIAVFAHRYGVFDPRTWRTRIRRLRDDPHRIAPQAVLEVLLVVVTLSCLVPQVGAILREPYIARAYVAPVLGKEDKQLRLKSRFDALLAPVGDRDVVLADPITSWPIPSSAGRIVYAIHPEWYATDEPARKTDVEGFFAPTASTSDRLEILDRQNVAWIVLNRASLTGELFDQLFVAAARAGEDDTLVLMDASRWRAAVAP